jgi:hypothetical protein
MPPCLSIRCFAPPAQHQLDLPKEMPSVTLRNLTEATDLVGDHGGGHGLAGSSREQAALVQVEWVAALGACGGVQADECVAALGTSPVLDVPVTAENPTNSQDVEHCIVNAEY